MYQLCVAREFIAQHKMVGADFGPEGVIHSHPYRVEVILEGERLDSLGFLIDIAVLEKRLTEVVTGYRDRILNDLEVFAGQNPSLENFARIISDDLEPVLSTLPLTSSTIRVWEHALAWAAFRRERGPSDAPKR